MRLLQNYIFWTYERGSIHYDIMVTLILIFVFLSPYWINFKDKPIERNPHPRVVIVLPDTQGGFLYQIEGTAITAKDDGGVRDQLTAIIEPIAGSVDGRAGRSRKNGWVAEQGDADWPIGDRSRDALYALGDGDPLVSPGDIPSAQYSRRLEG